MLLYTRLATINVNGSLQARQRHACSSGPLALQPAVRPTTLVAAADNNNSSTNKTGPGGADAQQKNEEQLLQVLANFQMLRETGQIEDDEDVEDEFEEGEEGVDWVWWRADTPQAGAVSAPHDAADVKHSSAAAGSAQLGKAKAPGTSKQEVDAAAETAAADAGLLTTKKRPLGAQQRPGSSFNIKKYQAKPQGSAADS